MNPKFILAGVSDPRNQTQWRPRWPTSSFDGYCCNVIKLCERRRGLGRSRRPRRRVLLTRQMSDEIKRNKNENVKKPRRAGVDVRRFVRSTAGKQRVVFRSFRTCMGVTTRLWASPTLHVHSWFAPKMHRSNISHVNATIQFYPLISDSIDFF